jgi:hypothetical protein
MPRASKKQGEVAEAKGKARALSHDETLRWITDHKAWRLARKTKPIWARAVESDEIGMEFQTADGVKEKANKGEWLCVGTVGEPWFQTKEKIDSKYELDGRETKKFEFDTKRRTYLIFKPKGDTRNWVAQVKASDIKGFYIRPNHDPDRPLYSPSGGYVVKDQVADPYRDKPKDVWLVQEPLFESTYELLDATPSRAKK